MTTPSGALFNPPSPLIHFSCMLAFPARKYCHVSSANSRLFYELRDDLDVRGVAELIDRRDCGQPVAAADKFTRVAGECRRIAGYGDDERDAAGSEFARLRQGALARRIEDDGVETLKLGDDERPPEQIAC